MSMSGMTLARIAMAAVALMLLTASPARADWLRAESERFVIYSDGDERTLRAYAQKLETFDRVLRLFMGLSMDEAPPRKLPIYLIGHQRELIRVLPDAIQNQSGVYVPAEQDIFAVATRSRNDDSTLLHEYAHHFMFQNFNFPYPAWFVEGFAEYYAASTIEAGRVEVGLYNENRVAWLQNGQWMQMEDLLAGRSRNARGDRFNETYYPLAWLLTHWFMSDVERRAAMQRYLADVGSGGDPVEALEQHTGLTPTALRDTLRAYMRGRIPYSRVSHPFPTVPVTIERLPRSANDLLLINQQLKIAQGDDQDALVSQIRALAPRHAGDPFAQLVLGRAEIMFGDPRQGETVLEALLQQQPDNVEALQLMALARMNEASDHPEGYDVAMQQMRAFLQRAYDADGANYFTFLLIAQNRIGEPGYPNENDLLAWELAYTIAPQLGHARFGLAQALMAHDRNAEAIALLQPLANDPHNPQNADFVRTLIARAEAGLNGDDADASHWDDADFEAMDDAGLE
ncbi:tetratricopeptide repeat protein [Brevundimonas sp.]|uniref:tetratricopeptide repeat protein n=1 Tax=Brevundimonas sp. TaxID=1871086 RepID=UPI001D9550AA|nr:tetratricopeptide repeat protein [Brevundimonas sp.]MBA4000589.1 hypothetical protein [Brevundimonas sp.]